MFKRSSLAGRLVTLYVLVLTVALSAVASVALILMTRVLLDQIDNDLSSSGAAIAQQSLNSSIAYPSFSPQLIPSPYYVYVMSAADVDIVLHSPSMEARYGAPLTPEDIFTVPAGEPNTLRGTESTSWRALWLTTNSEVYPAVAIAYPLEVVETTQSKMVFIILLVALFVIAFGALASYVTTQSSLKPLKIIEHTTQEIAYGDLSRRVPTENMGPEVSHLATSFNIMVGQIESAIAASQRSQAMMSQFVSDASHELRTPLASVRGYAELYRMGGVSDDKVPAAMERIESEARRMGVLVDDLLELARLDESRPLNLTEVDLVDVAGGAVMDFAVRAPAYPVELEGFDGGEPSPIMIRVDRDKIFQVIANLLTNVKQHTPEGTRVEVVVGSQTTVSPAGDVEMAVVSVRDHGPGISPENRTRVFERFFRVDVSRSRASGGSGLGLAIVSSIVTAHRGTATITDTPGGGTTVTLTFPTHPFGDDVTHPRPTTEPFGR